MRSKSKESDIEDRLLGDRASDAAPEGSIWGERNILILALCWAITLSTSTLLVSVGPLSAVSLGANDSIAPLTVGAFLMGAAASSYPSGLIFRYFGRLKGFSLGCLCQALGCLFGCIALQLGELWFLMAGCFFIGLGQGLGQFYRFSAVEVCPSHLKSEAVTLVLTGGVLAAFTGPTTANFTKDMLGEEYLGSYLFMGVMGVMNQVAVLGVNFNDHYANEGNSHSATPLPIELKPRPVLEVISQPSFVLSCTIATVAHSVMTMLMSNCSLAMDSRGYSFTMQTYVMESHFCAMFIPGFYSGKIIKEYGPFKASLFGAVLFTASAVSFATGTDSANFFSGMILLGLAWNFSFSAGTVMLTECYRPCEAPDIQAVNDLSLFTVAGACSIASGFVYAEYDWDVLVYAVSTMMVLNLLLLVSASYIDIEDDKERTMSLSAQIRSYSIDSDVHAQRVFDEEMERLTYAEKVRSASVA